MDSSNSAHSSTIRLRGHHLLCLFGFRGLGYDDAFVVGMSAVVRALRTPQAWVEICAGLDDLCAQCPHRTSPHCNATDNARDIAVLQAAGYVVGDRIPAIALFALVAERVSAQQLTTLCAACPWYAYGYCVQGLATGRIASAWQDGQSACAVADLE